MNKNTLEYVILVGKNDNETNRVEKMEAHRKGLLHRAISVFICNSKSEWLLQKRATGKYHSGGLWSNTCCSHPFPGETNEDAANRRLSEEMGLKANLKEIFQFTYKAKLDNQLTEYEIDHVFLGVTDEIPVHDPNEVDEWKYVNYDFLKNDIKASPEKYTEWLKKIIAMEKVSLIK